MVYYIENDTYLEVAHIALNVESFKYSNVLLIVSYDHDIDKLYHDISNDYNINDFELIPFAAVAKDIFMAYMSERVMHLSYTQLLKYRNILNIL